MIDLLCDNQRRQQQQQQQHQHQQQQHGQVAVTGLGSSSRVLGPQNMRKTLIFAR